MEIYVVEYNGNRIGTYLDYNQATLFILSCLQSKLMNNYAYILTFKTNSCYYINQTKVELDSVQNTVLNTSLNTVLNTVFNTVPVIVPDAFLEKQININSTQSFESSSATDTTESESDSESSLEHESCIIMKKNRQILSQNKVKLQHKINLLKLQKERIEESKNVYENDLKLFNIFKGELINDDKYVISELFKKKFDLFKKLEDENRQSWDNFVNDFQHENFYNQHFEVNLFEKVFESLKDNDDETSSESNISEELEIDSDSN